MTRAQFIECYHCAIADYEEKRFFGMWVWFDNMREFTAYDTETACMYNELLELLETVGAI